MKKFTRRGISFVLAVMLVATELSVPSSAESLVKYSVEGGSIYFDSSTGLVARADKTITKAVIPDSIEGVKVTGIGDSAFQYCQELVSVTLPAGLSSIGQYAFRFDESLESVTYKGKAFDPFDENDGVDVGYLAFTDCFFLRPDFSASYKKSNYYRQLHSSSTRDLLKGKQNHLSDIIVIAKSQLGYHEGNSLDDMDGSSYGYGDYSEYTYWWGEPGEMWCGEFVGWCIAMASVPTELFKRKYHGTNEYKWKDTSYAGGSYSFKQGDVLHFEYDGGNHVCLVYSTSRSGNVVTVKTLDGNHTNDVSWGSYQIDAATGNVLNEWSGKNAKLAYIYSADMSLVKNLTYHTVHFDVNGGDSLKKDGDETNWFYEPDMKELTYGACYGIMPVPTRDGYEFAGWYTAKDEGVEGDTLVTSYRIFKENSDQTLYARWVKPDKGFEPSGGGSSSASYEDEREVTVDGLTWKFDYATGTITKINAAWTGGEIPGTIDGVAVKRIGDSACYSNSNVTSITFPDGLESIGKYAFGRCMSLQKVTIPERVASIGEQCFIYCYELEDVEFEGDADAVRKGRYAFMRTPWLHGDFSDEFRHGPWYAKIQELSLDGTDMLDDAIAIGEAMMDYHEGDERSELTGINPRGNGEYAEPVFFAGSPDYLWVENVPQVSYGGWCGQYCSYILRMAGMPSEASGMIGNNDEDELSWSALTVAGGDHELKRGDVMHMRIGHYCVVYSVEEKGDWIYVTTLNGNHGNAVSWDTYKLYKSNGYQRSDGVKSNYDVTDIYRYNTGWEELDEVKAIKHTVSFNANGGTVRLDGKTVYEGAYYGILPDPEREGYVFDGWYTAADGGKKITAYRPVKITADTTLYAHWHADSESVCGVTVSKDSVVVLVDKKVTLSASVYPSTAANKAVSWKSGDTSIATVDDNGVVTGVSVGEVNIIAISDDGSYMARCKVEVADGSIRYDLEGGGGYLKFNKDTGTITGADIDCEEVVIPDTIEGVAVKEIGRAAFSYQSSMTSIVIPEGVEHIGVYAFEGTGLKELTIPSTVKQISSCSFYKNTSLTTVYIPNSVRRIYYGAFDKCDSLETVTFQGSRDNLKYLADNAFPESAELIFGTEDCENDDDHYYEQGGSANYEIGTKENDYEIDENGVITKSAYQITNAQIPATINDIVPTGIKQYAFGTRSKLKSLSIPDTVTDIDDYAFWECAALETLYIPDSVVSIGRHAFDLSKQQGTKGKMSTITIGSGIRKIGDYAFDQHTEVEQITIRANRGDVTVGKYAFPDGVKVIFADDEVDDQGKDSGDNPGSDSESDHGNNPGSDSGSDHGNNPGSDSESDHGNNPGSDSGSDHGNNPGSDSGSDSGTDHGSEPVREVTPKKESESDNNASIGEKQDTSFVPESRGAIIDDEVTGAGYVVTSSDGSEPTVAYKTAQSHKNKSITIPDFIEIRGVVYKVASIEPNAFKNNKKLKKITIGKNIKKIGKNAFYGCKNLKTVTIKTTLLTGKTVGKNAFKGIHAKAKVKVPKKKLKSYQSILKKAGIKGKKQKIKK